MFQITTRVTFPAQARDRVIAFGAALRNRLETQPGLIRVEFLESTTQSATEMRSCWQSESDYERWIRSDDYRGAFQGPKAFDFEGCSFSSEKFEAI